MKIKNFRFIPLALSLIIAAGAIRISTAQSQPGTGYSDQKAAPVAKNSQTKKNKKSKNNATKPLAAALHLTDEKSVIERADRTAEEANRPHVAKGYRPPYQDNTPVVDVRYGKEKIFARVHGENNQPGAWILIPEDTAGLSPAQIKDKYALPQEPTLVSDVYVSSGTLIRVGIAGPQEGWGRGGGTQYELLERIPLSSFRNKRPLK